MTTLERTIFETSRAAEYFTARELQAQTGQPRDNFAAVALKELVDNALDACETAGTSPWIRLELAWRDGYLYLSVEDNGSGLHPDTVKRILNFDTRTSDKTVYRAPTRGAQGNALKTVLGMPCALGCHHPKPVVIDARGVRHKIRAWIDPAGELRIEHDTGPVEREGGTWIRLVLPKQQWIGIDYWARAFALFNPHASVSFWAFNPQTKQGNNGDGERQNSYQATANYPGDWRKFLPTDLTSPWWYMVPDLERLIFSHIADARRGGKDLTLREFVRQFRGLSGTAKAKAVCDQFPTIGRLSDIESCPALLLDLLPAMQGQTKPPGPGVLGLVGKEHFETCFSEWYGVKRFWYRKAAGLVGNIPFVFEAALAETEGVTGDLYAGLNFSPTYEDPFANTLLEGPKFRGYGLRGFLDESHALPAYEIGKTVAAVHLVCPALEFLDRGKTRLQVPAEMAAAIANALWLVAKDLYQEEERRRKDAARQERVAQEWQKERRQRRWSLKDAVFEVLPEALDHATGGGALPVSARDLYYAVRRLLAAGYTDKELGYSYFSQTLLTEYRETNGPIKGLYRDPRGVLYEPHTGKAIPLGTREVDRYDFPAWLYDKILYIEKKGKWPQLEAARLAERFDLAVIAAEGYATEAARTLFERADKNRQYRLFVVHDADAHGYNIARTLSEETRRMPGYHVEVVDLGLTLADALDMGLETETFTRKKGLPEGLELTDLERKHFEGREGSWNRRGEPTSWICQRIELNALTAPDFIKYIERKLEEAGAADKVIPPDDKLPELAGRICRDLARQWAQEEVDRLLAVDKLKKKVVKKFLNTLDLDQARGWIETAFDKDSTVSWRAAVETKAGELLPEHGLQAGKGLQAKLETLLMKTWED